MKPGFVSHVAVLKGNLAGGKGKNRKGSTKTSYASFGLPFLRVRNVLRFTCQQRFRESGLVFLFSSSESPEET